MGRRCTRLGTPFHGNLHVFDSVLGAHIILYSLCSERRLAVCDKKTSKSSLRSASDQYLKSRSVPASSRENVVLEQYTHCVEIFNEALSHPTSVPSAEQHDEHLIYVIALGTGELALLDSIKSCRTVR